MDKIIENVEENKTVAVKAITKRCNLCRTAVIWNEDMKWWDCPKCGNVVF